MLTVVRYLNGKPIKQEDIKNIVIESELIHEIIRDVNSRIKKYCDKEHSYNKTVEKEYAM